MKKEIIKLLDADIINAIEDIPQVSLIHCVPKKGGMAVVTNDKSELVPTIIGIVLGHKVSRAALEVNKGKIKHQLDAIFTISFTIEKHPKTYKDEYPLSQSYLPISDGNCGEHAHSSWEICVPGQFLYSKNGRGCQRDDRITFLIDKAIRNYHFKDDTCFRVDVIDEVMEEEFNALAVEIKEILEQEEEFENSFKVLPFEGNQRIKNSILDSPTNLVMKPLLNHLEYAFLEKYSLLSVAISTLLQDDDKKHLVSILKKHKEAFSWKTSDIPGISPSFCKHKIKFEDDAKLSRARTTGRKTFPLKLGDLGSFLIPYTVGGYVKYIAFVDLGASINLMLYSLYASLSGNTLKPTRMSILLANHTYQYLMGIAKNMLVQVGKFVFLTNFVILQMEEDDKVPLILGRPFLHTVDAMTIPTHR
nr:reverse transcriptase domain-containing protein [Tanacetum cinerariifolium]GEX89027.1 reverse transcriptase domain-containing protein [Tanacetum cinerariifolium]